jgi:hypothetical protein
MATETPLEGDVYDRRKQTVIDEILQDLTLRHKLGVVGMVGLALLPAILTTPSLCRNVRPCSISSMTVCLRRS